jgi:hypothetical protein
LSNLRSEVFNQPEYDPYPASGPRAPTSRDQRERHRNQEKIIPQNNFNHTVSTNRLSMDDMTTSHASYYRSTDPRDAPPHLPPHSSPSIFQQSNKMKDSLISRAVIETEQMGLRLTDEIQRLRIEVKRCREMNRELNDANQKLKAEGETLKLRQLESTQTIQNLTTTNQKLIQDTERLKLELVLSRPLSLCLTFLPVPIVSLSIFEEYSQ